MPALSAHGAARLLARCAVWLLAAVAAPAAQAHTMPASRVTVEVLTAAPQPGIRLQAQIPLHRLEAVLGEPLADRPAERLAAAHQRLSAYLLQHVGGRSDGAGWTVLAPTLRVTGPGEDAGLLADLRLIAPGGRLPARMTLWYDAVTHELPTHQVLLHLQRDPDRPLTASAPRVTGLRHDLRSVELDLRTATAGTVLVDGLRLGVTHLLEGGDHVLFLLLLLLPAAQRAQAGRWVPGPGTRQTLWSLCQVVTGFTLGHAASLVWGTQGGALPPPALVETAIALTLLVSAAHALRPLVPPHRMPVLACAFGAVHGMAFSQTLLSLGLGPSEQGLALLGFNLGIELAQLLVLALPLPGLLMLARAPQEARLRIACAALCAAAAGVWLAQRLQWLPADSTAAWDDLAPLSPLLLAAVATAWGLRHRARSRRQPPDGAGVRGA